jgi:murein DD-endopeptidase
MTVKMPLLGQPTRRRSGRGWLVVLLLATLAGGYLYRRRRAPPPPPPVPVVAPAPVPAVSAPPAVLAGASAPLPNTHPALPVGARFFSVGIDGPMETAVVGGAGAEVGPALAQVVKRVLVWWMAVPGDLRRGDTLEVVYEPRAGEEPRVSAVRIQSGKFGRAFEAYRFQPAGAPFARFYTPAGEDLEQRLVPSPLDGWEQITSLLKDGRRHKGVDFKTPVGTPVKATFDGTITRKTWFFRGNGNSLEVTESASPHRRALFLHLSELPRSLKVGTRVTRGEVIAHSGNSGHSFAPHLHYQLMSTTDRVLDPFEVQPTEKIFLPPADRPALTAEVARLKSLMTAPVAGTVPGGASVGRAP